MIHYYSGNRLEDLAEVFKELVTENPLSPFSKEKILIQTEGVKKWLTLYMAKHTGIFAGADFISPSSLMYIAEKMTGSGEEESPFSRDFSGWAIYSVMDKAKNQKLKEFIKDDPVRKYETAERTADLFDQYALYRWKKDGLADKWNRGELTGISDHEVWQQELWSLLQKKYDRQGKSRFRRLQDLLTALKEKKITDTEDRPERIICFGISILPPYYLEVLKGLSENGVEVHLFFTTPCRFYWADIISRKRKAFLERKMSENMKQIQKDEEEQDLLYYETGNPLLGDLGRCGSDFLYEIYNTENEDVFEEHFKDADDDSLLHRIQNRILNMEPEPERNSREDFPEGDESVKVVSCHSPMREVQVLQDYLWSLFDEKNNGEKKLQPWQVLVLCPDINAYAPYIDAVFGKENLDEGLAYIPYSIADRSRKSSGVLLPAFAGIMDVLSSRFEASSVFSVLEMEPVRKKFGLSEDEMGTVSELISGAGIKWGKDSAGIKKIWDGIPGENTGFTGEFTECSWQKGIDRLMAACVMDWNDMDFWNTKSDVTDPDSVIFPLGAAGPDEIRTAGKLAAFVHALGRAAEGAGEPKCPEAWKDYFLSVMEDLLADEKDNETERNYMTDQAELLERVQKVCGFTEKDLFPFEVMKNYFDGRFSADMNTSGFITGGVTFCSMIPLRSIPFKVICMLGMNEGVFPRTDRPESFDLMAVKPERGDRSTRNSDRYLFLETIMSARDKLYISYTGQDIRTNKEKLPSGAVSLLLEHISRLYKVNGNGQKEASDLLVTKHPLQAFSSRYFTGKEKLFSYRKAECAAAEKFSRRGTILAEKETEKKFRQSEAYPEERKQLRINDLISFFKNPQKFFLCYCMGAYMDTEESGGSDDAEIFEPDNLTKYDVQNGILRKLMGDAADDVLAPELKRRYLSVSGIMPVGVPGTKLLKKWEEEAQIFFDESVQPVIQGREKMNFLIDTGEILDGYSICDSVDVYRKQGEKDLLFSCRPARLKGKDVIRQRISILAAACSGFSGTGLYAAADKQKSFPAVSREKAMAELKKILKLYLEGRKKPVAFFTDEEDWSWELFTAMGKKSVQELEQDFGDCPESSGDPYADYLLNECRDIYTFKDCVACAKTVFGKPEKEEE